MSVLSRHPPRERPARPSLRLRQWKTPIVLGVFALLAVVLFVAFGRSGSSTFTFDARTTDWIDLPSVTIPARGFGVLAAVVAMAMAVGSAAFGGGRRRVPRWYLAVFSTVLLVAFLAWSTRGHTLPIVGLLAGSLALSVPLVFGALGGVLSERAGVVNIALEGQLLAGAFASAVVASVSHSSVLGLLAAAAAGVTIALLLTVFSIRFYVDQVIVGVVLNVLVLGLTSYLYSTSLTTNAARLNAPDQLGTITVPGLSGMPVIGPVLFNQTIIVYFMYFAVAASTYAMFKTRWGLRLRSVGEHPKAADTVGIDVNRTRVRNVALAGAIVGFGGAYFTLGSVGAFTQNVTSGAGYIALAAVISGGWNPIRATIAALLFGFVSDLQSELGIRGSSLPSEFLLMLPYVVTIAVVAGLANQSRGPAASGKPYVADAA